MSNTILLPTWLIVLLVGLPQLSETVYTPSLPDIAVALSTSASAVEYTLTIYLFGFAIGTLFWGKLSDKFGRKPCVLAGIVTFILGCIGCYFSDTITALMGYRFVQAFGGSIGSVLGQAICRDAFSGQALGRIYATVSSSLALFPAIGPIAGEQIAKLFGWQSIFLFLGFSAVILALLTLIKLPETHINRGQQLVSVKEVALSLAKNKKVYGFGLIVAACNGILFSYFAEGPFFLINMLGLSSSYYSLSFIGIALATIAGGAISKKLNQTKSSQNTMYYGIKMIGISTLILSLMVMIHYNVWQMPAVVFIIATILSQMVNACGICMATSNALALALIDYKHAIGTASSLFGFFYYCLISLFTLGMGYLHNGTLLVMPLYFCCLSFFMILVNKYIIKG